MARFLVDESLPRSVVRALVAAGHDAVDGRDVGLRGKPDAEVASRARAEQRIIVSADLDFSSALRFPPGTHPGILVTRLPDAWSPEEVGRRVAAAVVTAGEVLGGAITIVEVDRIRSLGPRRPNT